jgi:EAL and modified HD-GYP domain-containing signal transduction protein
MNNRFIARQPIFDSAHQLCGYELLYRNSLENCFPIGVDDNEATTHVISLMKTPHCSEQIIGNIKGWINLTEKALLDDSLFALDPERCVLEVLEHVTPSSDVIARLHELASRGYVIALDDFIFDNAWKPAFSAISIIKYDIMAQSMSETLVVMARLREEYPHLKSLAEKVEDGSFMERHRHDFDYFQGFVFAEPEILSVSC